MNKNFFSHYKQKTFATILICLNYCRHLNWPHSDGYFSATQNMIGDMDKFDKCLFYEQISY